MPRPLPAFSVKASSNFNFHFHLHLHLHLHPDPVGERKLSHLTCFVWPLGHCHNAPTAPLGHDLYEEFVHNSAFAQLLYENIV